MRTRVVGLVAFVVLFGACSSPDDQTNELAVPEFDQPDRFSSDTPLPFDQYRLTDAEFAEMQGKEVAYFDDCLADAGIATDRYQLSGDYVAPAEPFSLPLWGGKLGTLTLRHVQEYGYHAAAGDPITKSAGYYIKTWPIRLTILSPGDHPPSEDQEDAVADAYVECGGQLPDAVHVEPPELEELESDLVNRSYADDRVVKALENWRSCMKRFGYSFEKIDDAALQFSLATKISRKEVATATADVKCTAESRWADYFYTVLADYQRQSIEQDQDLFNEYKQVLEGRYQAFAELAV